MPEVKDELIDIGFRVHVPLLLEEIASCGLPRTAGALKISLRLRSETNNR